MAVAFFPLRWVVFHCLGTVKVDSSEIRFITGESSRREEHQEAGVGRQSITAMYLVVV